MKYSITNHVLFEEKQEEFTSQCTRLEEELVKYGMDISLLENVIEAVHELAELQADAAFEVGFEKGWLNGKENASYQQKRVKHNSRMEPASLK